MGILVVGLELKATKGVYLYSRVHTGFLVADKSQATSSQWDAREGRQWLHYRLPDVVGSLGIVTIEIR